MFRSNSRPGRRHARQQDRARRPGRRMRRLVLEIVEDRRLLSGVTKVTQLYTGGSTPQSLTVFNNELYFQADDGIRGAEPWKLNAARNASLVADINPDSAAGSYPASLTVFSDELYFSADGGGDGVELWKVTAAGTVSQVADIHSGIGGSYPRWLTVFNDQLYFQANDGARGAELWKLDTGGTLSLVADIWSNAGSSNPAYLTVSNGGLYFQANTPGGGTELWKATTTGATSQVADIRSGNSSSSPTNLAVFNGELYFQANDGSSGAELWKVTAADIASRVADIKPGGEGSAAADLTVFGGALYFQADDGNRGPELWKVESDGQASLAADINPGGHSTPSSLIGCNGDLHFRAFTAASGAELWKVNPAGVASLVADIGPGSDGSSPAYLTVFNGELYFQADDGAADGAEDAEGAELWKIDAAGATSLVADINPGAGDSYPAYLTVVGDKLYFQARDDSHGAELWMLTTLGAASRVADVNLGRIGSFPSNLTVLDDALYFSADENGQNGQIWRTGQADFGDAPDPSDGSGADNYHTRFGDAGPQPTVTSDVRLGATSDGEDEAWPSADAAGDDSHGDDDEDGLVDPVGDLNLSPLSVPTVRVSVTNLRSVPAALYGWIDYNGNGEFENGTERASVIVPPNTNVAEVTLTFPAVPMLAAADTFARFRLSTDPSAQNPTGAAVDGEVEDYLVRISTVLVTTAADENDGPGVGTGTSLREAMVVARSTGVDRIGFAIPGLGSHSIVLTSPLPPITQPLTIDATRQPGIVLDGTEAGAGADGLVFAFTATSTAVSCVGGLEITGFSGNGILVSQPLGAGGLRIQANTIHGNAGAGVRVAGTPDPSGVSILSNSICANGGPGIDLDGDGVTANDVGDADGGANQRQNFPVLVAAESTATTGTLNSTPGTTFTVQFFASAAAAASGYGDGQTYLGQLTNVTSDGTGNASFRFPHVLTVGQPYVTSTATDPLGNTSEFSAALTTTYSGKVSVARSSHGNGSEAGPNDGQFTVTLSAASSTATTVTYTLGGSATEGDDYAALAVKGVTIAAGGTSAVIDIDVTDDALVEDTETVTVTLTGVTGHANITLNDAQSTTLSNASTQAVTVDLGFTGTANLTADYTRTGTQIVTAAGSLSGFVTVTAVPDTVFEGEETIVVDITGVANGTESGTQKATTAITDDDPTPSLSIDDVTVDPDGNAGTKHTVFTVTLSAASGRPVTVNWATADDTAKQPGDYASGNGTLKFDAGVTTQTITVAITDDLLDEINEQFKVKLSEPVNATIGDGEGVGTIVDDDDPAAASPLRYDFGTSTSSVQAGFVGVVPQDIYSPMKGYGWVSRTAAADRQDPKMSDLRRDLIYARDATFKVALDPTRTYSIRIYHANPISYGGISYLDGIYQGSPSSGGVSFIADNFSVSAEGLVKYTVANVPAGGTVIRTISNVTLSADGVLELRFCDLGGRDGNFVVSGLEISVGALPAEAPLLAEGDPRDEGAAPVTLSLLQLVAAEASARWAARGLTADQTAALSQVEFAVADLGAAYLGLADTTTKVVRIDDDAAGLGWSLEWSAVSGQRSAVTGPWSDGARSFPDPEPRPLSAGVDLLTVAMHEMGHLLGYEHRKGGFVAPVLSAGRSSAGSSAEAVESLGRAEWRTGLSSFALSPSSRVDGVFTDLGHDDFEDADGSRHAAPSLLAPGGGKTLAAASVKASMQTPQMRVPRRSRLPWIERELDTWFAELADAEERLDPKMQPDP